MAEAGVAENDVAALGVVEDEGCLLTVEKIDDKSDELARLRVELALMKADFYDLKGDRIIDKKKLAELRAELVEENADIRAQLVELSATLNEQVESRAEHAELAAVLAEIRAEHGQITEEIAEVKAAIKEILATLKEMISCSL